MRMCTISLVLIGLLGLRGTVLAAEPVTSSSLTAQKSTASPKETGKGQWNSEDQKGDAANQEPSPETPPPAASSKPSTEANGDKPEAAAPPVIRKGAGKAEGKSEVPKEIVTDAPKEGAKTDGIGADHAVKLDGDARPPAAAKTDATPQKRPLGSDILTAKLTLLGDARIFPYDIEVEMDGDKAILSGRVATEEDRLRAEELVQRLDPVNQVINKLEVVKDLGAAVAKRHDHTLVQFVKDRFSQSETLKAAGFDVTCERGVIHLSGTVRFQVFALEAAQAARQVPGVIAVDTNNVKLLGEGNE